MCCQSEQTYLYTQCVLFFLQKQNKNEQTKQTNNLKRITEELELAASEQ